MVDAMASRSRIDVSIDILNAALGEGTTKTRLMYEAFVSFEELREYLSELIKLGLMETTATERIYKTTRKGKEFLSVTGDTILASRC